MSLSDLILPNPKGTWLNANVNNLNVDGTTTLSGDVLIPNATASFTPTLQFGGGSTGITYLQRQGRYFRIGNLVMFSIIVSLTSKGSSTGQAIISGLPVASSSTLLVSSIPVTTVVNINFSTGVPFASIASSSTLMFLGYSSSSSTQTFFADTDFANDSQIGINGFYFID